MVDKDKKSILSRQNGALLNLVQFIYNIEQMPVASATDEIQAEYKNAFGGISKMPGKFKIHKKPGAIPSVQHPKEYPWQSRTN